MAVWNQVVSCCCYRADMQARRQSSWEATTMESRTESTAMLWSLVLQGTHEMSLDEPLRNSLRREPTSSPSSSMSTLTTWCQPDTWSLILSSRTSRKSRTSPSPTRRREQPSLRTSESLWARDTEPCQTQPVVRRLTLSDTSTEDSDSDGCPYLNHCLSKITIPIEKNIHPIMEG